MRIWNSELKSDGAQSKQWAILVSRRGAILIPRRGAIASQPR
ncbi:MAG: hypothetical protein ACRC8Y_26920 [Chroococcales cyanobacterium]